jgi:60 kDa SS-A/Ro ribonucleoprotein
MAKYNSKKETRVPTETNLMGEKAFKLDPKEELVATVLTTFIQKSYYETENEILTRIREAAAKVDPLFVAKTAIYTRKEANMRSSSHVLAGELARRISGTNWASRFYNKIIIRPDDMSEILGYYMTINKDNAKVKIPNAIKRAFKNRLENLDPYLIDKYKMSGRKISLVDLVNLFHPTPNQKNAEAFKRLVKDGGKGLGELYSSKILEKEMSAAGQTTGNKKEAKKEAIISVLENSAGMPIFNLLRNLRNILLYAPGEVDSAIKQLTTFEKIKNSRLLPFRFLSAYNEISSMKYSEIHNSDKIVFEDEKTSGLVSKNVYDTNKTKVLAAIEKAIELSCVNIPVLEGRTAILIDHSGSMRGDGGGSSLVSALSKTTSSDIANVFAAMLLQYQPNVYVGLFGDKLISYNVDRNKGILETAKDMFRVGNSCGGSTEAGIYEFFKEITKTGKSVDNIIIFSDQVIGDGNRWYGNTTESNTGKFREVFKNFKSKYPNTKVVSVDIRQTSGSSVFDKSYNVTQISGWSDKIFNLIETSTVGYKAILKEIEAIEI